MPSTSPNKQTIPAKRQTMNTRANPNAQPSAQTIATAIRQNRGGHENTPIEKLLQLWQTLTPETQRQYLASVTTA